ncbi:hypothetical protein HU200_031672 [Digitaria exilis]|uniref:Trichome birefringence-like N-terminal domain-containing protein n=1 Tax=Digitaria exilis TaxID=1010633 RepID=A0A835BPK9_9POAL|nr:hypothetical protein HU200_031672 [Digitaria exilis]
MPGWRKAWLSVLDRAGGGSGGSSGSLSLQAQQLQGLHSSSSSSSSLASYKRGGKHGSGKAVAGCFCAALALALAFFYVSVTGGPGAADDSFASPAAAATSSSSRIFLSWAWLSSSNSSATSSAAARKSLLPHPHIPPAATADVAAAVEQSDAGNATVGAAPRRVQGSAAGDSSSSEFSNGTVDSDAEPQVEAATPMLRWRRTETDGASSSNSAVVHDAPGQRNTDVAAGNATVGAGNSSREEETKSIAVDNVQNSAGQVALLPSRREQKEDKHRRNRRSVRHRRPRRRKGVVLPAQDLVAERDGETAVVTAAMSVVDDMAGVNTTSMVIDGTGNGMAAGVMNASTGVVGAGDNWIVWTSGVQDLVSFAKCDVFNGRWVRDESYGFYPPKSCALIDDDFNCHKNGRLDSDYLKWRWQPQGCDIPRLNATEFLERLRGQRIIFVGDSLNRNMWESLVCILRHGVRDKRNVHSASGRNQFKTRGYYSFKFREYNCSVDFIRSIFLVKEMIREGINGTEDAKLKLDELDATTPAYRTANIVVFNTGHWLNYYQEGNHVYRSLEVMDAYRRALTTWARWVDKNIDSRRTQIVFRGYSLAHFRGGQWNSGGRCHGETEPIFNQTYLTEYPEKMVILEQVLRQMKTPVIYLNISALTDYRKDGHPSVYRKWYATEEERMAAVKQQDCSHWCLPGVPDTWNELLYASLLQAGKGSWKL